MTAMDDRMALIRAYHTASGHPGLVCPLCRSWNAYEDMGPAGIRWTCRSCRAVTVMPRAPLARAIGRTRLGRAILAGKVVEA
jgi:hypothetical protein